MSVVVVGLEQRQAPLDLLERVAIPEDDLGKTLAALRDHSNLSEVVVLSTCLRTEIYAVVERFHDGFDDLRAFLAAMADASPEALADHLTVHFDDNVAFHLFAVAAGLRSPVPGEYEVLGQVRRAAEVAAAEKSSGPVLGGLFRSAVHAGRRARATTAIARGATSLSQLAAALAGAHVAGDLADARVVVVGAGRMGQGVVRALSDGKHVPQLTVVNRSLHRARQLADAHGAEARTLDALGDALVDADAVIVATAATSPVVDADHVALALARRRAGAHPLVAVDLGVPRNVDPAVRALDGVELLDMDDLRAHAERALADRRSDLDRAQAIVDEEVEKYRVEQRARGAAPAVAALRGRLEELRTGELARARRRRDDLTDDQWAAVEQATRAVLAKVMHQPSVALKEAAGTSRGERLAEALRALFDL